MSQPSNNSTRIHAIDALRACVMFCVVLTHAVIPYMTLHMPDLRWSIYEPQGKVFFDWVFVSVRGFTMPIFFLIAGFWSMYYRERLSVQEFIHKRAKRIVVPLFWGMLIILPITYYVWAFGWMEMGECFLLEIFLWKFSDDIMRNLYGPVHLWFLIYLLFMMAGFLVITKFQRYFRGISFIFRSSMLHGFKAPFILALPTICILSINSGAMWNFHNTLLIEPFKFLHYSWFFVVGTLFFQHKEYFSEIQKNAWLYVVISIPLLIATKKLLFTSIVMHQTTSLSLGVVNGLYVWISTYAVLGMALKYLNKPVWIFRYFADASYWFYLTHFTLIGALQLMLYYTGLNLYIKCSLATVLTLVICTWTYHHFVRYTFVGSTIHKPQLNKRGELVSSQIPKKFLIFFILLYLGCGWMIYSVQRVIWEKEKIRYTQVITDYYWIYLKRAPDQPGLEYWVGRAMDRMGLKLVEKEAFIDEVARDRAKGKFY